VCNGPEKKQDGKSTRQGVHHVYGLGSSEWVVTKEYDKEPAKQYKERCTGRVGELHLVTGRNELAAVPKTAPHFGSEYIHKRSDQTHSPSGDVVKSVEIHTRWFCLILKAPGLFSGKGKNREAAKLMNGFHDFKRFHVYLMGREGFRTEGTEKQRVSCLSSVSLFTLCDILLVTVKVSKEIGSLGRASDTPHLPGNLDHVVGQAESYRTI